MTRGGLLTTLTVGETLLIGEAIVTVEARSGNRVRLRVNADPSIKIVTPKKNKDDKVKHG